MDPLTALRFPAAFWVMLFHYVTVLPQGGIRDWSIIGKGYLAVDFFFILGGFILSHAHGEEIILKRISFKDFYIKRLARIYPLHFLTLLLYIAGIQIAAHMDLFETYASSLQKYKDYMAVHTVANHLMLLHGWWFEANLAFNKPSWSISSEWFAYLLFPVLVLAAFGIKSKNALLLSVIFLGFIWVLSPAAVSHPMTELTYNFSILRIVPEFILGMALYCFGRHYALTVRAKAIFYACISLIIILSLFPVSPLCFIFLFGVTIYSAAEMSAQGYEGFFSRWLPVYLGKISYSIYMLHFVVLDALYIFWATLFYDNKVTSWMLLAIWLSMFALTFVLSPIIYQLFEKPCRFWICRRFLEKKE